MSCISLYCCVILFQAMQAKKSRVKVLDRLKAIEDAANSMTRFQIGVILAMVLLIAAGCALSYLRSRPRKVEVPVDGTPREKNATIAVHITGAVARPGLYHLGEGSRVADALNEAGGPLPGARIDALNLAERLRDGEKILVPGASSGAEAPVAGGDDRVNLNTASVSELEGLPGIGPSLAERIVEYREKNGPFSSVDELDNVEGIGPGKLKSLKERVTI